MQTDTFSVFSVCCLLEILWHKVDLSAINHLFLKQNNVTGEPFWAFQTGYNPRASGGAALPPGLPSGALPLDPIGALKRTPGPHAVRRSTGFALSGYWIIALPVTLLDPPLKNNIGLSWEPNVVLHETNGTGKRISSAFISCQIMSSSAWKWQNASQHLENGWQKVTVTCVTL